MVVKQLLNIPILLVLCPVFCGATAPQCSQAESSIYGMMLRRHVIRKITGISLGGVCLLECYRDVRCQSFNYLISRAMCELNNRTKEARPEDFVPDSGRYYFRRDTNRVPLGSIPELPAETCKEIKASEGGQAVSGKYWFDSIIPGKTVLAHCDMDAEAGLKYSSIVGNNQIFLAWLDKWLKPVTNQSSYWNRCYRATVNGWSSYTFHSNCDGKGPSVTIIRVGKYIFGGYTSLSWSRSGCSNHYDSAAFLFSLVNKPGWQPVKLDQTGQYSHYRSQSIYSCSNHGPIFGNGHDIYIANNAASSTSSFTNLGYTYSPPAGNSHGSSFTKSFLAGTYNFRPDEVEVFYETT